ncbi:hypothetical protein C1645_840584 [Glomus cerebriforme]|uniref:SNTX MACPF/CDC-like domain-containing protein n=1 Tax=Glomus cerebriforme TaxID=658196 RepID=A0A397RZ72_9GLOM|nr:hypothetical protein C1645_840584 [Glomus cerebriforme]
MAGIKRIKQKSLGRVTLIGSLYNVTRDTFCETTLLKMEFPNDSISRAEISNTELLYGCKDSHREKFNNLDVEAELKLSVLVGLVALEGTSKYLSDVKESFKSVKGSLIYKLTSIEENLNIYHDDIKACISTDGFSNLGATHVVIEIRWRATMIALFECKILKEEDKSQVEEALKSYFKKLSLFISRNDNVNVKEDSNFSIKLFRNFVLNNKMFPQSFDEVRKVMAELPSYTKQSNDGKGFLIEYTLYPLLEFVKLLFPTI